MNWRVLPKGGGDSVCLERLSLRCGYRIGEIASALGCGERYFHEVFTRDIGLPPKQWMRWERMVVACRKLAYGRHHDEVAADLGFLSTRHFRREFRGRYGVSPAEFQQRAIGERDADGGIREIPDQDPA